MRQIQRLMGTSNNTPYVITNIVTDFRVSLFLPLVSHCLSRPNS